MKRGEAERKVGRGSATQGFSGRKEAWQKILLSANRCPENISVRREEENGRRQRGEQESEDKANSAGMSHDQIRYRGKRQNSKKREITGRKDIASKRA